MTLVLCEGKGAGFVLAQWDEEELMTMDDAELGQEILKEVKRVAAEGPGEGEKHA